MSPEKKTEYVVANGPTVFLLADQVNELLADGWEVVGSMSVTIGVGDSEWFYQPMMRTSLK